MLQKAVRGALAAPLYGFGEGIVTDEVQETIDAWPVGIRAYYAKLIERMCRFGPNLGMPFTRSMGQGMFEIRARGKEGIGRAFFCTVVDRRIIILHAFTKKSQKTPAKELAIARKRLALVKKQDER